MKGRRQGIRRVTTWRRGAGDRERGWAAKDSRCKIHNDRRHDEFLTLEFCREYKLFQFGYNPSSDAYEIESREFPKIKQQLLFNLTNIGRR
jgi:spore cortex formation protein SpoVR/YcgB (stage V sporulation)